MIHFHKQIVTDEASRPVAVQVKYDDWLEIERLLATLGVHQEARGLMRHSGKVKLSQEPLLFQSEVRGEWR